MEDLNFEGHKCQNSAGRCCGFVWRRLTSCEPHGFYGNRPIWFGSGDSLGGFWFSLPLQVSVIISPRILATPAIGPMAAIFNDPLLTRNKVNELVSLNLEIFGEKLRIGKFSGISSGSTLLILLRSPHSQPLFNLRRRESNQPSYLSERYLIPSRKFEHVANRNLQLACDILHRPYERITRFPSFVF
jgi:hypothetical protein